MYTRSLRLRFELVLRPWLTNFGAPVHRDNGRISDTSTSRRLRMKNKTGQMENIDIKALLVRRLKEAWCFEVG